MTPAVILDQVQSVFNLLSCFDEVTYISAAKGLSARELYHVSRLQALRTLEQVKQRKHVATDPPITTKTA